MKRVLTTIFAIIMIIAITIPSFSAANTALNTSQKVSFTAECNKAGYEFSVYKIASLVTSTSPYSVKYNANVSSAAVKAAIADGNITESERAKILNELDKDTALSGATIVGTYKVDTDGTRKTFSNLAQGIYYVRATNFPAGVKSVANSAFALPYYTAENGWVYNLDTINLASKVEEDNPTIEKKITNSTKNNVNFTDVSIGDTVNFEIKTSTVGSVNAVSVLDFKLNSYIVTDLMSKGLTLNQNSFAVALKDDAGTTLSTLATTDYTVNVTAEAGRDTTFTVALNKAYLNKTDFYDADYVVITYSAVLNKYATTENVGNPNEAVKLTYSNKNDVTAEVDGNTVYAYTFKVQAHKYDEAGTALAGADFALYATQADAAAERNAIATGTSDADGIVVFYNANHEEILLQSGNYFVKETRSPAGYNRYTDVIPVTISATYGNTLTDGSYIVSAPEHGLVSFDVKNSKTVLPQTGGAGNVIIYSIALTLAAAGVVVLLVSRKKKSSDKAA